jgi:hypothetical protein
VHRRPLRTRHRYRSPTKRSNNKNKNKTNADAGTFSKTEGGQTKRVSPCDPMPYRGGEEGGGLRGEGVER